MRRRMAWAIPWLLAAALPMALTQGSTAQDDNLLANGGFEDGAAGWLAIGGDLTVSDALVRSGSSAGLFATAGVPATVRQCLPVAPSADYEFWGYAARREGDPVSSLHLRVFWWDQENCLGQKLFLNDSPVAILDEGEHWYELAVGGRSPSTARSAYLTIEVQESEATVHLDDFTVSGPPAPTETPTPTPEPSPSASPTRTPGPWFTPTPTATPEPPSPSATPRPSPSPTPRVSPTASSWQMTPVPAGSGLRNGDFEEADSDGLPSFWRKYGGKLARTSAVRFEGQFAATLTSETSSTKWAYQIVPVRRGKAYVLSAYALKNDPAIAAAYLRLSWYASPDASGQAIDSADSTEPLTEDSPGFRFLTTGAVVPPEEAASAKVRLMLDPIADTPGTVYFDAVTFEETTMPELSPSPTASSTVMPSSADDLEPPPPYSPPPGEPTSAPPSEPRSVASPPATAARPPSSMTTAGVADGRTPAALSAMRTLAAMATTAAAIATRAPANVYRQPKFDPLLGDAAAVDQESVGGSLSPELLVLATAIPALAAAGLGAYYRRWRRARLR